MRTAPGVWASSKMRREWRSCLAVLALSLCFVALLAFPVQAQATAGDIFKTDVYYGALTYAGHAASTLRDFGPFGAPVDINGATAAGGWRAEEAFPDEYTILAPEDGRVDQVDVSDGTVNHGNEVVWSNAGGTERLFMIHLASVLKTGSVKAGEPIALIGKTGNTEAYHLHIARQQNGVAAPLVLSGRQVVPYDMGDSGVWGMNVYQSRGPLRPPPAATVWKTVTPPSKFVSYAKHARKHGIQAWYPRRIPKGYVIGAMSIGDMGKAGPYCDIVFKKGSRKIYFSQGTVVGADGELPARSATCRWGTSRADVYSGGSMLGNVVWFTGGSANGCAGISGSLSLTDEKSMAKTMRKVP